MSIVWIVLDMIDKCYTELLCLEECLCDHQSHREANTASGLHVCHTKRPGLDERLCDHRMEIRVQTD